MRFLKILLLTTALSGWLTACSTATTKEISVTQPDTTLPAPQLLTGIATAGAVSVDITPPPGLPMGGYSLMANRGKGFRTRIKARIIYLNDGQGHATALVQTDLTAGSLLLHHKVVSLVADQTGLKSSDIIITASHSHSAPVNHFENDFYNKHMSSGAGLNEAFLAFTSRQIADGIQQAFAQRRPAKIATGRKDINGYNRNRALDAYLLNKNIAGLDTDLDPEDPQAVFKAVNPALYMIRIDVADQQNQFKPLAAFSTFSVHATALSPAVEVYNADLFAYAQKDLEWALEDNYGLSKPAVHALTTGTQGDMAPALPDNGDNTFSHFDVNWPQAKKLGQGIGREAISLFEDLGKQLTSEITITTAGRELNIRDHNKIDNIELCQDPAVGAPVAAGAYERRTPYLAAIPFFKGGNIMSRSWFFTDGCQGNKTHLGFKYIQPLVEPIESFPDTVLFQLIKINDAVIIPMPFEVTTEAGRRMASEVKTAFDQAGKPVKFAWVTSNSNGYFGYATTPEEYALQKYEGGHTLYGKYSTPYLTAQLGLLTRDLLQTTSKQQINETASTWQYQVTVDKFYPPTKRSEGHRQILEQPSLHLSEVANGEDYIRFRWLDVNSSEIAFHQPLLKVERKPQNETDMKKQWQLMMKGNEPISDDGYDIEIRYLADAPQGMGEYEARWYNPIKGGEYRFTLAPRADQAVIHTKPFNIDTLDNVIRLSGQQP